MENSSMSKKEYLKKYLSGGDKKKKKKKKSTQSLIIKSKIVDDDIDLKNMKPVDDDELEIFDLAEEAPQIAGIIDERPEEIRIMSEYRSTKKWKIVADEFGIEDVKIMAIDTRKSDDGSPKRQQEISIEIRKNSDKKRSNSDASPSRKSKVNEEMKVVVKKEKDVSPPRRKQKNDDSDESPPRKGRRNNRDSDASPPRKGRKNDDSDVSPPRKGRKKSDDSDASPPRRSRRKDSDSDASPPRRKIKKEIDSDSSPPRRRRRDDLNASPPSRKDQSSSNSRSKEYDHSRSRYKSSRRKSVSPKVLKEKDSAGKVQKDENYGLKVLKTPGGDDGKEKKISQLEKTLSGKKAGLQSAEDMIKESAKLRQKEKEMFEKMSDDLTGRYAEAIVRNRKTGRKRDAKEEARLKREKEEKEAEKIAQYAVWGKGVKQVQDRQEKIQEELYEMSKPLARYKDDKDLDAMLRNQERDGDPMLEYIRRKKKEENGPSRPEFQGSYLPNRYNIRPGHKWDGVDRSNGYEKRWFEEQNAKKAREEEAFKWSTEDM